MTELRQKRRIRVLESVQPPGPIVQYIDQIVVHAPDDIDFAFFSYKSAIFGRYDVFHVHWPEWLIRHRTRLGTYVRGLLFLVFILRLRTSAIPVVRTVHNLEPHDAGGATERLLLGMLDKLVHTRVVLTKPACTEDHGHTIVIPHGHYREVFHPAPSVPLVRGRVLLFGNIKPYKGAIELIRAAEALGDDIEVRIVGSPTDDMRAQITKELTKPGRAGAKVTVRLQTVPDKELSREIAQAELVILPYRNADNSNSGAALLALSLDRPILTTRSVFNEQLAEETGENWVQMVNEDIKATDIEQALFRVRKIPNGTQPELVSRDWSIISSRYARTFRNAVR